MSKKITRRAALGAFVLTFTIVLNGAPAQPRAAFGGVRVDVASLRAEVAIRPRGGSLRNFRARSQRVGPASGALALRSRYTSTP